MATNEEGIAFVILGKTSTTATVNATKEAIIINGVPANQSPLLPLNCSNCDMKITIANPFTKPYITDCGTRRMNFPNFKSPTKI